MPKISELPQAAVPLLGSEELACVQNGITVQAKGTDFAKLAISNFALTGEVKTLPGQPFVTVIDKSINPVWVGTHVFGAGIIVTFGQLPPAVNNPNVVAQFMGRPDNLNPGGIQIDGFGQGGTVYARRSNGTPSAPSHVLNGDVLGSFNTPSFDGSVYGPGVRFQGLAAGDWTPTSHPAVAQIQAAAVGSTLALPIASFYGSGGVRIGAPFSDPGASNLSVANSLGVGADMGVSGNAGITGTLNVGDHLTAERLTVGSPPSTDTGPGDIYLIGGIGVNVGVVGASGTVNAAVGYYVNGDLALDANTLTVDARTVAALGAATAAAGALTRVSDGQAGLAPGAVVVGGGTTPYLVWSNGTAWTIIGH